jgi:heme-degrading monooxygenase HmoA
MMSRFHIAQVNIGKVRAELDDPIMEGFVSRLEEINALADSSPGFVWRLQESTGNATYLRPYDDNQVFLNMSVWETVEALRHYVFKTAHAEMLRQRQAWFEKFVGVYTALWWVPAGHVPGIDEAKKRLAHLEAYGPTRFAFTFKTVPPPDEEFQQGIDWTAFQSCPAV